MSSFQPFQSFYKHLLDEQTRPATNEAGQFHIFKLEDLRFPDNKPISYSRRDYYKISLITGHSKIHYADQCIEVFDTALVFTNPMVPYFWETVSEIQTGFVCIFTADFPNRSDDINAYPVFQQGKTAVILLDEDQAADFKGLFLNMSAELEGDYTYKYQLLRNQLMQLIHAAQKMQPARGEQHKESNAGERITALFLELLERQFPIELNSQQIKVSTASAFAERLNVHTNHLNKVLKEHTGQTTSQLITARVLQEAKVLLKGTNWTITEIARSLAFDEANHFSSFFKNRAGITPGKFRQAGID